MRILTTALVSLLALSTLVGAPLPAASGAEARHSPASLLDGGGKGGGGDGGDNGGGDKDDDDEDVRALG